MISLIVVIVVVVGVVIVILSNVDCDSGCAISDPVKIITFSKVNRYEDLLLKARQQNSDQASETVKWRERTTELLQNIEQLNEELEELKAVQEEKQRQNQETQTEVSSLYTLSNYMDI